jgi:response regulator RpfG family c-di-GMP phosphodiesterase
MARVLFCDDDDLARLAVSRILSGAGHECCAVDRGERALALLDEDIDVLIADLHMPGMSGTELLVEVAVRAPDVMRLLISGAADYASACVAVNQARAHRILPKPFVTDELLQLVDEAARARATRRERRARTDALVVINQKLRDTNRRLDDAVAERTSAALDGLVGALHFRDSETQHHSRRVAFFARRLGEALGISEAGLIDCEQGALLHDVGKIGVRDAVLLKPGPLTPEEWVEMKRHPQLGHQLLSSLPFLRRAAEVVLAHHERWDGTGYPRGIAGEAICLGARIFAVVDAFDAITSDRPYRRGRDYAAARAEIVRCSGTQFDPRVVAAFCSVPENDWAHIRENINATAMQPQSPINRH